MNTKMQQIDFLKDKYKAKEIKGDILVKTRKWSVEFQCYCMDRFRCLKIWHKGGSLVIVQRISSGSAMGRIIWNDTDPSQE